MTDAFGSASIFSDTFLILSYVLKLWPFWVAPFLAGIFWDLWVTSIRAKYIDSEVQKARLLEIKFPQEVTKTPLAMEIVIQALYQTGGEGTWYAKYWEGKVRQWFSLEMASFGGSVHFYIWAPGKMKATIEQQLYSQYPGIEVFEAEDYSHLIEFEKGKTDASVLEYDLARPSPYPIKTYVDFGLDKSGQDEEYKIDPLTTLLEYLGSLRANEQAWVQIMIRAHKKEKTVYVKGEKKTVNWEYDAVQEIEKIKEKYAAKTKEGETSEKRMTKGDQEIVYAIERNLTKLPFDVGIRSVYIAPKENYDPGNAGSIAGIFGAFSSPILNGIAPKRGVKTFDYPWQETEGAMTAIKKEFLKAYRLRAYFHAPYRLSLGKIPRPLNVMNTEALATIFHIPGSVAQTPSLGRVLSKKSEAPANLPI